MNTENAIVNSLKKSSSATNAIETYLNKLEKREKQQSVSSQRGNDLNTGLDLFLKEMMSSSDSKNFSPVIVENLKAIKEKAAELQKLHKKPKKGVLGKLTNFIFDINKMLEEKKSDLSSSITDVEAGLNVSLEVTEKRIPLINEFIAKYDLLEKENEVIIQRKKLEIEEKEAFIELVESTTANEEKGTLRYINQMTNLKRVLEDDQVALEDLNINNVAVKQYGMLALQQKTSLYDVKKLIERTKKYSLPSLKAAVASTILSEEIKNSIALTKGFNQALQDTIIEATNLTMDNSVTLSEMKKESLIDLNTFEETMKKMQESFDIIQKNEEEMRAIQAKNLQRAEELNKKMSGLANRNASIKQNSIENNLNEEEDGNIKGIEAIIAELNNK